MAHLKVVSILKKEGVIFEIVFAVSRICLLVNNFEMNIVILTRYVYISLLKYHMQNSTISIMYLFVKQYLSNGDIISKQVCRHDAAKPRSKFFSICNQYQTGLLHRSIMIETGWYFIAGYHYKASF